MASSNPFDLLGDDDSDEPSQLIAAYQQHAASKKTTAASTAAKLPSKPVPPAQAVREAKSSSAAARGGVGRGRGGSGQRRDFGNGSVGGFGGGDDGDAVKAFDRERGGERVRGGGYGGPRQPFRGGRRGGYVNGEAGGDSEQPGRRVYERRSGTGHGYEMKREGAGRGNWGTAADDVIAQDSKGNANAGEDFVSSRKQLEQDGEKTLDVNKESKEGAANESEEKEPENKEMTLEEYEKIREEKRKALLAMKTEERKVDFDKEFESMKQLSIKKGDDIFIQLGPNKDAGKRKENVDQEERIKKAETSNGFLIPTEPPRYSRPGGRGRGRGDHGPYRGGFGHADSSTPVSPAIEDPTQFPTLGGK
ncbi:hypothetical protein J5N97_012928 [Dioscorea zingiberensis]|uniref:Hyaluronan/mRNA-binding protein domain-containing protein n=1 Tax=Dioscorea zingiberensis TaxID=325984 RepID=A0A9D5CQY7_9LILI|nr:hypothetical protein J5N97_012928 [Dioscorea zingiberensis]